jgi:hypothetical protein
VIVPAARLAGICGDALLVGRLRDGDERAFKELVAALYAAMFAVARSYVRERVVAEKVGGIEARLEERRRQSEWLVERLELSWSA